MTAFIFLLISIYLFILISCIISNEKHIEERNSSFLKTATKHKAVLMENILDTSRSDSSDISLSKSSIFIGKNTNYSNVGFVKILDSDIQVYSHTHMYCTFPRLALKEYYPEEFDVYIGEFEGKTECFSADYFENVK